MMGNKKARGRISSVSNSIQLNKAKTLLSIQTWHLCQAQFRINTVGYVDQRKLFKKQSIQLQMNKTMIPLIICRSINDQLFFVSVVEFPNKVSEDQVNWRFWLERTDGVFCKTLTASLFLRLETLHSLILYPLKEC